LQAAERTSLEMFGRAVDAAIEHIEALGERKASFDDKLVAVVRGPELPPLTLVDLPGLIQTSNAEQNEDDIETVREIVESYMAVPSSVILAVLAADNNFANQVVLQLAKAADPETRRTMGIITKPDKVDAGSRSEFSCIEYAQNRNTVLGLGWHVLRNRGFDDTGASAEERNQREAEFFRSSRWRELASDLVGATTLRNKLSRILLERLQASLPSIVTDVRQRITVCETQLLRLEKPKLTESEQRVQLTEVSAKLHKLIAAAVEGNYRDPFFSGRDAEASSPRRLRARLRDILEAFSSHLCSCGNSYDIAELVGSQTDPNGRITFAPEEILEAGHPIVVSQEQYLAAIAACMKNSRGYEPEGIVPVNVIQDAFRAQTAPWGQIACHYADQCSGLSEASLNRLLDIPRLHTLPTQSLNTVPRSLYRPPATDCRKRSDNWSNRTRVGASRPSMPTFLAKWTVCIQNEMTETEIAPLPSTIHQDSPSQPVNPKRSTTTPPLITR
jgi:hypothetical protein